MNLKGEGGGGVQGAFMPLATPCIPARSSFINNMSHAVYGIF